MDNLIKLNLARNCLRYIIKAYHVRELFMPFYICPELIKGARKEKCQIKFYHIDKNFYPLIEFPKNAFILYPNYFGICCGNITSLAAKYQNLIVDNAHNVYLKKCGLASFNSLRKFFNVKDGAYLYINKTLPAELFRDTYTYKEFTSPLDYEELSQNETRLNSENIKLISATTERIVNNLDLEKLRKSRLEKFYSYHKQFKNTNELHIELTGNDVPFVYPYLIKDTTTGASLEKSGMLILRYWKPIPKSFPEYDFYKYLIPIPLN